MLRYVWPAIIGALAAISVAVIQHIVAPLVTRPQLQAAIAAAKPEWKVFPELTTDTNQLQRLGKFDVCTLTTVGTAHFDQACTCELKPEKGDWTLKVALDQKRRGSYCRCQAACLDFKAG